MRQTSVEGYEPAQPWGAPAATAGAQFASALNMPPFPTVQDLDNEFDGFPESGNPFIERETPIAQPSKEPIVLAADAKPSPTLSMIVADIICSEDKNFLHFLLSRAKSMPQRMETCASGFQRVSSEKPGLSSKRQISCRVLHRTPLRFSLGHSGTPLLVGI
jgi:hypothetical protein